MKEEKIRTDEQDSEAQPWKPTYKWLATVAGFILLILIIVFFTLNIILKSHMRERPIEITPWLDKNKQETTIVDEKEITSITQSGIIDER